MIPQITITKEEQRAIASLRRLAKKWPETLQLFGWSGSLVVMKKTKEFYEHFPDGAVPVVASINGIHCDGGDGYDVSSEYDVKEEQS